MPKGKKKGKKKSKKQLEKERQLELQRIAEEQARLAAEAAEAERQRKIKEEEERKIREALMAKLLAEEKARLEAEGLEVETFENLRQIKWKKEIQLLHNHSSWLDYVECSREPKARVMSEVQTFLTMLKEKPSTDPATVVEDLSVTEKLLHNLSELIDEAYAQRDESLAEERMALSTELRKLSEARVNEMTAHYLHHAEEVAQELIAAVQAAQQQAQQSGALSATLVPRSTEVIEAHPGTLCAYGLWVNLNKSFKNKKIEFPHIDLEATFSKALASMGFAFRYIRYDYSPIGQTSPSYVPIGGIQQFELLTLPPPSRTVKKWTIRPVTPLFKTVAPFPFSVTPTSTAPAATDTAAPAGGQKKDPAPVRVVVKVPQHIMISHAYVNSGEEEAVEEAPPPPPPPPPAEGQDGGAKQADAPPPPPQAPPAPTGPRPLVGWWDSASNEWRTEDIADVRLDMTARTLEFGTAHFCPHALLVPRGATLPYHSWSIRPLSNSVALFTVDARLCEVRIEVHPDRAILVGPEDPELAHLLRKPFNVTHLLRELRHSGANLLPTDDDEVNVSEGVSIKNREAEKEFHHHLSAIVPAFGVTHIPYNRHMNPKEFLFRIWEADVDEPLPQPPPQATPARPTIPALPIRSLGPAIAVAPSDEPLSPRLAAPPGTFMPEIAPFTAPGFRPPMLDETKLLTVLYEHNNCRLLQYRDGDAEFDSSAIQAGKKAHLNVVNTVKEITTPNVISRLEESTTLWTESIRVLFDLIRPLSFG